MIWPEVSPTEGAGPVWSATVPRRWRSGRARTCVKRPARRGKVVDVTGGGDALIAGTLANFGDNGNFITAVENGIDQAAMAVAKLGAV